MATVADKLLEGWTAAEIAQALHNCCPGQCLLGDCVPTELELREARKQLVRARTPRNDLSE